MLRRGMLRHNLQHSHTLTGRIGLLVQILAILLEILPPANARGKAAGDGSHSWAPAPVWENWLVFSGRCRYLKNERAENNTPFFSL